MGGGNWGGSDSGSSSSVQETKLSKEQAAILKKREDQYQEFFFPELINMLDDTKKNTLTSNLMTSQAKQINQQSKQSQNVFAKAMAQRGLTGSGVEAQGIAAMQSAKSNTLANAFAQAQQANLNQKNTAIQLGMGMSPKPTTAAPIGTQSSSDSSSMDGGFRIM